MGVCGVVAAGGCGGAAMESCTKEVWEIESNVLGVVGDNCTVVVHRPIAYIEHTPRLHLNLR